MPNLAISQGLRDADSSFPQELFRSPSPINTDLLEPLATNPNDDYIHVEDEVPTDLRVAIIQKGLLSLDGYPRSEEMREVLRMKALGKLVAVYTDMDSLQPGRGTPRWAALFWSEDGHYVEVPWDLETKNLGPDLCEAAERIGEGI